MAKRVMNEQQENEALIIMRFQLSEIINFEDMVYGRGYPSTYTEDDVKMYIRGIKDNISGFFKRNNIPEKEPIGTQLTELERGQE